MHGLASASAALQRTCQWIAFLEQTCTIEHTKSIQPTNSHLETKHGLHGSLDSGMLETMPNVCRDYKQYWLSYCAIFWNWFWFKLSIPLRHFERLLCSHKKWVFALHPGYSAYYCAVCGTLTTSWVFEILWAPQEVYNIHHMTLGVNAFSNLLSVNVQFNWTSCFACFRANFIT